MHIQYCTYAELQEMTPSSVVVDGSLMVMPFTNAELSNQAANVMSERANSPGLIWAILDAQRVGFVQVVNAAFLASQSTWFGYVAQDAFAGRRWLALALEALGKQKHFLGFNDGKWAGALAAFGLARRSWALQNYPQKANTFFYPQYARHYADAELTLLSLQAGVYAYEPNSVLVELDWDKDSASVDEADRLLFTQRKAAQFDGKVLNPVLLDMLA